MRLSFPPLKCSLKSRLVVAVAAGLTLSAAAQSGELVPPVYPITPVVSGAGAGAAADAAGNVYLPMGTLGTVVKVSGAGYNTGSPSTFVSGLGDPVGVAVDPQGHVWVADYSGSIDEYAADGMQLANITAPTPLALAVSSVSGTVYFTDSTSIYRVSGNSYTTVYNAGAIGFALGLAVGPDGSVYVADAGNADVEKLTLSASGLNAPIVIAGGGSQPVGNNGDGGLATSATFGTPSGIAVDRAGNIYVEDALASNLIRRITPDGRIGTYAGAPDSGAPNVWGIPATLFPGTATYINGGAGLPAPGPVSEVTLQLTSGDLGTGVGVAAGGLSLDAQGRLLMPSASGQVLALPVRADFGQVALGSSAQQYWFFQNSEPASSPATGDTLAASPIIISAGAFSWAGGTAAALTGNPCASGGVIEAYKNNTPPNGYCEIDLSYSAFTAGPQSAGLQLSFTDGGPNTLSLPLTGLGLAEAPGAAPAAKPSSQVDIGVTGAQHVAVDPWGNTYFSVHGTGLFRVNTGGGTTQVLSAYQVGLFAFGPGGTLTFSAAGTGPGVSLYQAAVTSVSGGIPAYGSPVEIDGYPAISGLAVDRWGNIDFGVGSVLYQANSANGAWVVTRLTGTSCGALTQNNGPASAFDLCTTAGIAVDANGNIYVADNGHDAVQRISDGIITRVAATGGTIADIAVDAGGNLYLADTSGQVLLVTEAASTPQGPYVVANAATGATFVTPQGLATDESGDLWVADPGQTASALALQRFQVGAGSSTFGSVNIGSNASNLITIYNFGNQPLVWNASTAVSPVSGEFAGGLTGTGNTCQQATALAGGASCQTPITFAPQTSGTRTGTVNYFFNGNDLLSIAASGTGHSASATATQLAFSTQPPASINVNAPFSVAVAVEDANGTVLTSDHSTSVVLVPAGPGAISGTLTETDVNGIATFTGLTASTAGTYTLQAAATNLTQATSSSITVNKLADTVNFAAVPVQTYPVAAGITLSATGTSTGAITYKVVSGPATVSGAALTITGAGTVVVEAEQAADANYLAASAQQTVTVNKGADALNFAAVPAQTYPVAAAITVSATGTSTGAITYKVVSGPASISGSALTITGAGAVVVEADQAADANYLAASAQQTVTVNKGADALNFAAVPAETYPVAAAITLSATGTSTGAITYKVVSGPATVSGAALTITGAGAVVVEADQAADANYLAASAQQTVTVNKGADALNFAAVPVQTYPVAAAITLSATGTSTGAITYKVVSGPATVSGAALTITGAGTVVVEAHQAADANYLAASAQQTITVNKGADAVNFAAVPVQTYPVAGTITLSATGTSTGAITYKVISGPGTVSGNALTITGAGPVLVEADQASDANYAAGSAQLTITVNKGADAVSFAAVPVQTYPVAGTITLSATGTSTGAITYKVISGPATISGSSLTITSAGSVLVEADQASDANYAAGSAQQTIAVNKGADAVNFAAVPVQTYPVAGTITLSATGTSTGAITYKVISGPATISGSSLTITSAGSVLVEADQASDANYAAGSAQQTIAVNKGADAVNFAAVSVQTYPVAGAITLSATGTSTGAITYKVVSGPATVSGSSLTITGAGSVLVEADQAADTNYAAGSAQQTITVNKGADAVSFAAVPVQTYPVAGTITLSATGTSTGAITYKVVSGPASISGAALTITGAGAVVVEADQAADANYLAATAQQTITVNKGTDALNFAAVPAQTYPVAAAITLSATGTSTGAITYKVVSGPASVSGSALTITGAGPVLVEADQAADANYLAGSAQQTVTVNKGADAVNFAAVPVQTYPVAGTITLTATGASTGAITYKVISGPGMVSGNALTITGAGPVVVEADQAADANYGSAQATQSIVIAPAVQTIIFTLPATGSFGQQIPLVASGGASGNPVTFSVTGPAQINGATLVLAGTGTVTVTAAQAGNANYAAATPVVRTLTALAATQVITFPAIGSQLYAGAPVTVTLAATSSAGLPVSYSVSGPGVLNGTTLTITGPGVVTVTANASGNADFTAAAPVTQSLNVGLGLGWGLYATAKTCGAITLNGTVSVDSYNAALGGYPAGASQMLAGIGTNGNARLDGQVAVWGSLYDPNGNTRGDCDQGRTALTSLEINGRSTVSQGIVTLPAALVFPLPPAPAVAPRVTRQQISGACGSLPGCTALGRRHVALAPGVYGNLALSGDTQVDLSAGTYTLNSLSVSGNSTLNVVSGPVVMNLAGADVSTVLDLTGGTLANASSPRNFLVLYAGAAAINLAGGDQAAVIVYAPAAPVRVSGNGSLAGTIVGATITVEGTVALHYDRTLAQMAAPSGGAAPAGGTSTSGDHDDSWSSGDHDGQDGHAGGDDTGDDGDVGRSFCGERDLSGLALMFFHWDAE